MYEKRGDFMIDSKQMDRQRIGFAAVLIACL